MPNAYDVTIPDADDGDNPLRALLVATFEPPETFDVRLKTESKALAMAEGKQASIEDLQTYLSDVDSLTFNFVTRENCPDKGGYPQQQPRQAHSARRPHTFPPASPIPPPTLPPTPFRPAPKPPKSSHPAVPPEEPAFIYLRRASS